MSMTPIPVPEAAEEAWRATVTDPEHIRKVAVGPPPGVSDDDCGTVESIVAVYDGHPVFCDYWRPTADQLVLLARGGFIELRQYVPQMPMHSLNVWAPDAADSPPTDRADVVASIEVLRTELTAAANMLPASPQQNGVVLALQYVVEQLNAILTPLGPPPTVATPESTDTTGE